MEKTKINFSFHTFTVMRPFYVRFITKCIKAVLEYQKIPVPCEINVLVTDDAGIRVINNASRNIDKPTDVLSFPMFQFEAGKQPEDWAEYLDPETGLCPLGDMAISLERAGEQAREYGHTIRREVGYLTIHSMLHLLGYDHIDEAEEKRQMRACEEAIAATISGLERD